MAHLTRDKFVLRPKEALSLISTYTHTHGKLYVCMCVYALHLPVRPVDLIVSQSVTYRAKCRFRKNETNKQKNKE